MIVLFFIGAIFLLFGSLILLSEFQTRAGTKIVKGQVAGFATGGQNQFSQNTYYAVAEFQNFDGQSYYVVHTNGFSRPVGRVGGLVQVYVRPGDLKFAAIRSKLGTILGAVLSTIGCAAIWVFFKFFSWDMFSLIASGVMASSILISLWKARRKVPITKEKWSLSKSSVTSGKVYSVDQRDEISWMTDESVQQNLQQTKKMIQTALPLTSGLALVCGAVSVYSFQSTQHFLSHAQRTSGQVVEMYHPPHTKYSTRHPIVEFTAPGTSQTLRFEHSISTSPPMYSVGDEVKVLFDPEDLSDARIDMGVWNFLIAIVTGSLALIFLLISISNKRSLERLGGSRSRSSLGNRSSRGA